MGQCNGKDTVVLRHVTPSVKVNGVPLDIPSQDQQDGPVEGCPRYLELKDRFGNRMYFNNGGDVLFLPSPLIPDPRQRLLEVRHMDLRPDDVVIAGFMKSGNHWLQQILRMLVQGGLEYRPNTLTFEVFEYIPQHMITAPDKPRVFFTHLRFHHLPIQVLEKKVKLIYLYRNPKDTLVSLYCHANKIKGVMNYGGTWDHFFALMMDMGFWHGDVFDYLLDWEKEIAAHPDLPILTLQYETLVRDTQGQVEGLNAFLGLGRSPELCEAIVKECQIDMMRQREEALLRKLDCFTNDSPGIYRKGKIGDWKNWFTPEQNRIFDQVMQRRMADSKRTFVFE